MELQILHWFESLHNPFLNPIMYGITMLGEKGIFLILVALAALTVLPKKYRKVGLTMAFALIISLSGCGDDSFEKHKLCEGVWVKEEVQDYARLGMIYKYDVYDFSEDGTYTYTYHDFSTDHFQMGVSRTYKMDSKNKQIVISTADEEGSISKTSMIPYYINDYTHNLIIFPNDSGESKYTNYASLSFVDVPDFGLLSDYVEK